MDGTTLIASAIIAVITEAATGASSGAAHAAYDALKKRLVERIGGKADVADALARLEQRPTSAGRQAELAEELEAAAAGDDAEIVRRRRSC